MFLSLSCPQGTILPNGPPFFSLTFCFGPTYFLGSIHLFRGPNKSAKNVFHVFQNYFWNDKGAEPVALNVEENRRGTLNGKPHNHALDRRFEN